MQAPILAGLAIALALPSAAHAAEARCATFGTLPDGRSVEAVILSNGHGMQATLLAYGAILQSLAVPDRQGKAQDVVLGYGDMKGYIDAPNYFGATVGRYANRIRAGRFELDGRAYTLARNNRGNALHGGNKGFDKRLWTIDRVSDQNGKARVTLRYVSADGEEGYPGQLTVTATYTLDENNQLSLEYTATTDKPTIVNLSNHSYFNLGGEASGRSIYDALLTIPADTTTPVDASLIPDGSFRPVAGTAFDFRRPMPVGAHIRDGNDEQIRFGQGYDENFVTARAPTATPHLEARVEDPVSGRVMEILSNQPGVQIYSGNFLDGTVIGKSGHAYRQGDALALEPQLFPDTPNRPAFGSARLDPGQNYRNIILYRFSTAPARSDR